MSYKVKVKRLTNQNAEDVRKFILICDECKKELPMEFRGEKVSRMKWDIMGDFHENHKFFDHIFMTLTAGVE